MTDLRTSSSTSPSLASVRSSMSISSVSPPHDENACIAPEPLVIARLSEFCKTPCWDHGTPGKEFFDGVERSVLVLNTLPLLVLVVVMMFILGGVPCGVVVAFTFALGLGDVRLIVGDAILSIDGVDGVLRGGVIDVMRARTGDWTGSAEPGAGVVCVTYMDVVRVVRTEPTAEGAGRGRLGGAGSGTRAGACALGTGTGCGADGRREGINERRLAALAGWGIGVALDDRDRDVRDRVLAVSDREIRVDVSEGAVDVVCSAMTRV